MMQHLPPSLLIPTVWAVVILHLFYFLGITFYFLKEVIIRFCMRSLFLFKCLVGKSLRLRSNNQTQSKFRCSAIANSFSILNAWPLLHYFFLTMLLPHCSSLSDLLSPHIFRCTMNLTNAHQNYWRVLKLNSSLSISTFFFSKLSCFSGMMTRRRAFLIFFALYLSLSNFREANIHQAASQPGGVGRRYSGFLLRGARRPNPNCPLAERRGRVAAGQVWL